MSLVRRCADFLHYSEPKGLFRTQRIPDMFLSTADNCFSCSCISADHYIVSDTLISFAVSVKTRVTADVRIIGNTRRPYFTLFPAKLVLPERLHIVGLSVL
jgi:hypothetical protein